MSDVVIDWNNVALEAIRTDNTSPPKSSRALAMVHAAIYDSVNALYKDYTPYHVDAEAPPGASPEAAAAAAAHRVLMHLYPAQFAALDEAFAQSLISIPDGQPKKDGVSLGLYVGGATVAWRLNDHSSDIVPYTPSADPGKWRPTPPGFQPALLPNWPLVTPFAMTTGSQFRRDGPPALTSPDYTGSFDVVKILGEKDSLVRTPDQTEIALFWADGRGTSTPPGHWNQIAQVIASQRQNSLEENARLFALLNIASADAAIAAWDCKYTYDFWRPITATREADTDGNPDTTPDPTWEPLIVTPPFPECVSGHSTFSGAAAQILALFYGDYNPFTVGSDDLPGVYRSYDGFSQAAYEAGRSRIYGGIHYEFSNLQGLYMGFDIGLWAAQHYILPIAK